MYLNKNAIKSRFPNTLKPWTQNKNDLNTVASLLMVFSNFNRFYVFFCTEFENRVWIVSPRGWWWSQWGRQERGPFFVVCIFVFRILHFLYFVFWFLAPNFSPHGWWWSQWGRQEREPWQQVKQRWSSLNTDDTRWHPAA